MEQYLQFISKGSRKAGPRSVLAEANVNKGVAGKKGATNRYRYRPPRSQEQSTNRSVINQGPTAPTAPTCYAYQEIHHNDNPFILRILPKEAKTCKQCRNDFCHRFRIIPNDLVFEHHERFYYPLNGDWKKKQVSTKEARRFYHADLSCLRARFPYFTTDYIVIPPEVREMLHESHKAYLRSHFSIDV